MKYAQLLSGGAIGTILGVAGTIVTFAATNGIPLYISHNEIASTYVGIAANILSTNKDDKDQAIRMWAVNVIGAYAPNEIQMSDTLKSKLINGEIIFPICGYAHVVEQGSDISRSSGTVR